MQQAMKPLAGQRVIDLTQNVAGPYCTQILADLGAEVIKVERTDSGDDTRHWSPQVGEKMSPTYATLNRGKKSLALDLDKPEGQAVLYRLLKPGSIIIHSLKPGSAEQRGLGYEDLLQHCPDLIYCALSAFGNVGPLARLPGYDPLIQAHAGIMSVNGHEDQSPARVGVSLVDMGAGLWSVIGILAVLAQRKDTGEGARVDTSLLETGIAWMTNPLANYSATGQLPRRMGSATAMLAPYEVFETSDAHVFIGCGADRMFQKLAIALGKPELAQDVRFILNSDRVVHRDALHHAIAEITLRETAEAIVLKLRAAGIPVSAVQDVSMVMEDPQLAALKLHRPLAVGDTKLCAVGTPIRLNGERPYDEHLSTVVGQDTRGILSQAGFTDKEIADLVALGAAQI
jgi:crotonobetainyl-CoA:carnitine CoA-transferase CaiB-like acyl-CoA transferase